MAGIKTITDKIDATATITPEYRREVVPPPRSVKIELTRKCNYRCAFCVNSRLDVKDHMPPEKYREYIKKIRDAGVEELGVFYFGESMLVPWLPDAIRWAKEEGFPYVFLTTNGSLATPEKVRACMEAGLDSLKFSFNYADEQQFASVANVSPKFYERVIENIESAYHMRQYGGHKCGLFASYIQYDGEQGERMAEALARVTPYLDETYALPLFSQTGLVQNDGWNFVGGNPGRAGNPVPPVPCWALFKEGHVNFDGTMNACCFGIPEGFVHGDLNTMTFMEAWNHEVIRALRVAHLAGDVANTPCRNCVRRAA